MGRVEKTQETKGNGKPLTKIIAKFSNYTKNFYITKLICNSDLYLRTRNLFHLDDDKLFLIGDNL